MSPAGHVFSKDQYSFNSHSRGSPKDHLCQQYFEMGPVVFDKKIFKSFHFGCHGNQNSAWNQNL